MIKRQTISLNQFSIHTIMKYRLNFISIFILFMSSFTGWAQTESSPPLSPKSSSENGLFDSGEILNITLRGKLKELLNNRTGDPKDFSLNLSYSADDSTEMLLPVMVKTRGHFRRMKENCTYPPLMIQFPQNGKQSSSLFRDQKKLKLVMPCAGEEYVIREWLVYKLYNLVTPLSFRARLVKVKLEDPGNKKPVTPFYGILLEDEKQMAKRNNAVTIEKKLQPEQLQKKEFLSMAVFQYLIGNTDWSVQYQQNIKLAVPDSIKVVIPIPYDFDHAGIVNAPYALPEEALQMNSVRQRRYRGYCVNNLSVFNDIIAKFNDLKNEIYKLYTGCSLLDAKYLKSTIQYLDEFYATLNNTKAWQKDFAYPCDKYGTGNVVIKGLKED